jgi:hypothetical protein
MNYWRLNPEFSRASLAGSYPFRRHRSRLRAGWRVDCPRFAEPGAARQRAGASATMSSATAAPARTASVAGSACVAGLARRGFVPNGRTCRLFGPGEYPTATLVAYGLERRCGGFTRGALVTEEIPTRSIWRRWPMPTILDCATVVGWRRSRDRLPTSRGRCTRPASRTMI